MKESRVKLQTIEWKASSNDKEWGLQSHLVIA